ncbi:MAG: hypothetical protein ACTHQQ_11125 [Solirubrobacteraceae bacterium]
MTSTILKRRGGLGFGGSLGGDGRRSGSTNWCAGAEERFVTRSRGTMLAPVPFVSVSRTQIVPIQTRIGRGEVKLDCETSERTQGVAFALPKAIAAKLVYPRRSVVAVHGDGALVVRLADSFGVAAWRCVSAGDLPHRLREAFALDVPSLIVVLIDYSLNVSLADELGAETVAT